MKIAVNKTMTAIATVLGVGLGIIHYASAEANQPFSVNVGGSAGSGSVSVKAPGVNVSVPSSTGGSVNVDVPGSVNVSAPGPAVSTAAVPTPEPVSAPSATASVKEVLDSIKTPTPVVSAEVEAKDKDKKTKESKADKDDKVDMPSASPKVPNSVKKVVNKLNEGTEEITLDSLNSAREAVVKLDVLIDIEKRLNDLTKLRKEREEKMQDIADSLPSSAYSAPSVPPPSLVPSQPPSLIQPANPFPAPMMGFSSGSGIEVTRIVGASGNYAAQIKDVDGSPKRIKSGDKLMDGSTVQSISRNGVTVTTFDKKTKTIQVKDVGTVFGGR